METRPTPRPERSHHLTTAPAIAAQSKGEAWHNRSAEEVLAHLGSAVSGLITPEVARQLTALVILILLGLPSCC